MQIHPNERPRPPRASDWNLLVKIGNENEAMRELLRDLRRHFAAKEVAFEEQPTAWYRDAIDALLNDNGG